MDCTEKLANVAFLMGSGASLPAGLPSIHDITGKVLSGSGVAHFSDGKYYFDAPPYGLADEYTPRVIKFLQLIKTAIDHYYSYLSWRCTNYEDLYYVSSQIHDSELGEYDNPAVQPFIDKIFTELRPILTGKKNEIKRKWELSELASEAMNYIKDIVGHLLSKKPSRLDHLGCVKDACLDANLEKIDIFTLNHDTVLERALSSHGISFVDGFGTAINNIKYWNPAQFAEVDCKVRIFKLHGSINWFRFRPDNGSWADEKIGISLDGDVEHTESPDGRPQHTVDGRPMFLIGTFNKILEYIREIYVDIYCLFSHALAKTQRLIICGYGFGDKGINTRVISWMYSAPGRRIVVIGPEAEKLIRNARDAISKKWEDWIKQGKLIILSRGVEEVSWQEIKNNL